jgi:cytochrome c
MMRTLFPDRRWPVLLAALGLASAIPVAAAAAASLPLVGNVQAGQAAFKLCSSCHQVGPRAHAGFGPQLTGVIGRAAASTRDYRYSEAMQKSGIIWSEAKLAAFLRNPDGVVPGTRMRFWGLSDEQKIADLLAYLKSRAP